jgi:hypothetical protein
MIVKAQHDDSHQSKLSQETLHYTGALLEESPPTYLLREYGFVTDFVNECV